MPADPTFRLAFEATWLDPSSGVLWRFQLFFYPATGEVEMFDVKNRRHFVKRVRCDGLAADQFHVGAKVTVLCRALEITAFGDEATRRAVEAREERVLVLVLADAVDRTGHLIQALHAASDGSACAGGGGAAGRLRIANVRMVSPIAGGYGPVRDGPVAAFAAGAPDAEQLAAALRRGPAVALEVVGANARARCATLCASGGGLLRCSPSREAAVREVECFFGRGRERATGACADTTDPSTSVCIIKPHLLREGLEGQALAAIQDEFTVSALRLLRLDRAAAAEFLEVYRGPLPAGEWDAAVEELASGPCIAVQVSGRSGGGDDTTLERLRELCGPPDPDVARALRPASLRARLGRSRALNGLHCTDLPDNAHEEAAYLFDRPVAAE